MSFSCFGMEIKAEQGPYIRTFELFQGMQFLRRSGIRKSQKSGIKKSRKLDVTPDFPKETKCIPICDIKVNTETVSRKKKEDYQRFTLNPGNGGSKHHKQSTGGCVRLAPATSS
jgi:hypothetical protein